MKFHDLLHGLKTVIYMKLRVPGRPTTLAYGRGKGPAVLVAGAGRLGFFFYLSIFSTPEPTAHKVSL